MYRISLIYFEDFTKHMKQLFQTLKNRQFRIVILERGKTCEASLAKSQLTAWSGFLD